jgi:hypothetical protein
MVPDLSKFIGEVWQYKPLLIILLAGGLMLLVLSLIDTHRHRKKIQKHRQRSKHH